MPDALGWTLRILGVALLALLLTFVIQRPRPRVEVTMRGTTRSGKLSIIAMNAGVLGARAARVDASWIASDGRRAPIGGHALGLLAGGDVVRVEIDQLHRGLQEAAGWSAIEVVLTARFSLAARARVELAPREDSYVSNEPAVRYVAGKDVACPGSPDGKHAWERRAIFNDGVTESWDLCGRCRHVLREPLSAADQATQARVREERAARERARMEEEFARREREEAPPPRRASRPGSQQRAPPSRADDLFPPVVAFYILELDPTRATWEDVLAAHRRLALAHHPDRAEDRSPAARAAREKKMQEVNAARDRLAEHLGVRTPLDEGA